MLARLLDRDVCLALLVMSAAYGRAGDHHFVPCRGGWRPRDEPRATRTPDRVKMDARNDGSDLALLLDGVPSFPAIAAKPGTTEASLDQFFSTANTRMPDFLLSRGKRMR